MHGQTFHATDVTCGSIVGWGTKPGYASLPHNLERKVRIDERPRRTDHNRNDDGGENRHHNGRIEQARGVDVVAVCRRYTYQRVSRYSDF